MTWEQSVCGKVEVDPGARYACGHVQKYNKSQLGPLTLHSIVCTCQFLNGRTAGLSCEIDYRRRVKKFAVNLRYSMNTPKARRGCFHQFSTSNLL